MKEFILFFNVNEWQVTGFYPYTSIVSDAILRQTSNDDNPKNIFLNYLWEHFKQKAVELGCELDNKIVIQITKSNPNFKLILHKSTLFIGKYDNKITLGLSLWQDSDMSGKNKKFDY